MLRKFEKIMILSIAIGIMLSITGCGSNSSSTNVEVDTSTTQATTETTQEDTVESAREKVIEKWANEADVLGTARYIEDIYKEYPDDDVIANIYFYCIAKQQYGYYVDLDKESYLDSAKEYSAKIDPDYSDAFSDEMHEFVSTLLTDEEIEEMHDSLMEQEDTYNSLTNSDKKKICNYIQERYDYYDTLNGGYSGDKYSDTIMQEAADKYGITVEQVEIIWMNYYSY